MPEKTRPTDPPGMNPPGARFVPQMDKDIRCAEIKTIPSMKSSDQPKTFKIGEYNRATASFEIPSLPNTPVVEVEGKMPKPAFNLSEDLVSDQYFQSSFARSIVSSQSKSLEYQVNGNVKVSVNGDSGLATVKEECLVVNPPIQNRSEMRNGRPDDRGWQIPGKENWDLRRAELTDATDDEILAIGLDEKLSKKARDQPSHSRRDRDHPRSRSRMKSGTESVPNMSGPGGNGGNGELEDGKVRMRSRSSSSSASTFHRPQSEYFDDNGSPLPTSCRSSQGRSSTADMTAVMLQSQVTTLQWQLRQAEAARQMHRAVLEQVVGFLQRTHRSLDLIQTSSPENATLSRVPRSRSVHNVDSSPSRMSLPRSESSASFHKAKSVTTIMDPNCPKHGEVFRELTWRRQRRPTEGETPNPSKLSEEAFRLMRTVQSLLNTREPDLTSRLHSGGSSPVGVDASSASSTASATLDSDTTSSDNFQSQDTVVHVGARPELQAAFGGNCSPIPGLPAAHLKDATMSLGRRRRRRTVDVFAGDGSPPQLSTSSADDESGFSSLNSFHDNTAPSKSNHCQEVGMKHMRSQCDVIHEEKRGNFQDIGLPLREEENCKIHRRWSSTPVDHAKQRTGSLGNVIRVLWV